MQTRYDYGLGAVIPGTPYRVTQRIAMGGMGAVYEVEDLGLGKRFALKTLHAMLSKNPDTAHRMRAEARMLGRLTHPNVVQVFTAGVTDDELKLPYIVMERLVGTTLRGLISARGKLELRTATLIALELLAALEQAHDLGLVHRDVKPDNLFLHRHKRSVRMTKLLDFGVADLVAQANLETNVFFGTFRYASPEQLSGAEISHLSDLYSVGLVLYEMLAGKHPFAYAQTHDDVAEAHLQDAPLVPWAWPAPLRAIVLSALAKDPTRRPADAWTFGSMLRQMAACLDIDTRHLETDDVDVAPVVDLHAVTRYAPLDEENTVRDVTLEVASRELEAPTLSALSPTLRLGRESSR